MDFMPSVGYSPETVVPVYLRLLTLTIGLSLKESTCSFNSIFSLVYDNVGHIIKPLKKN